MAAKIYRKTEMFWEQRGNGTDGRRLVEKELQLLSKLDHPNILKVLDSYEDDHKIYFIINEIKGGSLFDRIIMEGNFDEAIAATISAYLVSITRYLHKNGVIMRNIRPENIMFEEKEGFEIKLIDLSLAILEEDYEDNSKEQVFEEFQRL